jgi:hypothetical protein
VHYFKGLNVDENISKMRKNRRGIRKKKIGLDDVDLDDVDLDDVNELLESHKQELCAEDLVQLEK